MKIFCISLLLFAIVHCQNECLNPDGTFSSEGTPCRYSRGPCDPTEYCSGDSADCPHDTLASENFICRKRKGPCDQTERCTGYSHLCPKDEKVDIGVVCRRKQDICDSEEVCDGVSSGCPDNTFLEDGTACQMNVHLPPGQCKNGRCGPPEKKPNQELPAVESVIIVDKPIINDEENDDQSELIDPNPRNNNNNKPQKSENKKPQNNQKNPQVVVEKPKEVIQPVITDEEQIDSLEDPLAGDEEIPIVVIGQPTNDDNELMLEDELTVTEENMPIRQMPTITKEIVYEDIPVVNDITVALEKENVENEAVKKNSDSATNPKLTEETLENTEAQPVKDNMTVGIPINKLTKTMPVIRPQALVVDNKGKPKNIKQRKQRGGYKYRQRNIQQQQHQQQQQQQQQQMYQPNGAF